MIEQCGCRCDVCGDFILSGGTNPFTLKGIEGTLMAHDECKPTLQMAMNHGTWQELPDGPIRKAFEAAVMGL